VSRIPTVQVRLRMTPTMRARCERYQREYALPSLSMFILQCVAEEIDRIVARRGEAYAEVPTEIRRSHTKQRG
jgi:hypothetical protein